MTTRFKRFVPALTARSGARGGFIALAATLAACSSLLGIEDLSTEGGQGAKGGAGQAGSSSGANGGKSGGTGSGGASAAAGKAGAAGKGGSGGSGGTNGGSGGSGGTDGGSGGSGGSVSNGGEAGSTPVQTGPVNGTIIDFWGHKLSGLQVKIGDKTTTTDASGKFSIADVPETYDVAFLVRTESPAKVQEWVYLGLTRRDPTLQCKDGFTVNAGLFTVEQMYGGTFDEGLWYVSWGSVDGGNDPSGGPSANSAGFNRRPEWYGPDSTNWTLHSLFLDKQGELPTGYVAYETQTAVSDVNDVTYQDFTMNLTAQSIDDGNVSGAIVDSSGVGRTNSAFVRFTSGAAIPVVDRVTASASSYQYVMPKLANSTLSVAAAETGDDYSYAIAHRDQNQPGDTGVDIVIPPVVTGLVPVQDAGNVGPTTPFTFSAGDPKNSGYLLCIEAQSIRNYVFIVTDKRQVTLDQVPIFSDNLILPNALHYWTVETHGQYADVDAMAGSDGFLDTFTLNNHLPQGPSRADGAYTVSVQSYFTTAP